MVSNYRCWVKCKDNQYRTWHTSNLLLFVRFLDKEHSEWRFFNVYDKKTNANLASFTNNNRPTKSQL